MIRETGNKSKRRHHPHAKYIRLLGGPTRCAELLTQELGGRIVVTRETVSNWERRGVAGDMRATFAAILVKHGHIPTKNFTQPRRVEAALKTVSCR